MTDDLHGVTLIDGPAREPWTCPSCGRLFEQPVDGRRGHVPQGSTCVPLDFPGYGQPRDARARRKNRRGAKR